MSTKRREEYMQQLDGLRFIAVSGVMISHYTMGKGILDDLFAGLGTNGVNLFFLLSGFLITQILLSNKDNVSAGESLWTFYVRRFLRIFPLYYFVIAFSFYFDIPECRKFFGWFVSYTANFQIAKWHGGLGYLSPLWSLSVEEQFYVFFPFIVLLFKRSQLLKVFAGVAIAGILIRIAFCIYFPDREDAHWYSYALTPGCLDCFGGGAVLAYLRMYETERLKKILSHNVLFLSALAAAIGFYSLKFYSDKNSFTIVGERAFFAVFAFWLIGRASLSDFKGIFGKFISHPAIVYLGKISYGLYVYHMIIPFFFHFEVMSSIPHIVYPFVTVAVASLSWHLYEHPINNLKRFFNYSKPQPGRS